MTLMKAIIMGVIQGLTEFLPVSSSGHLALMKYILNINTDTGLLFDVLLHFGTLLAIIVAFYRDIRELVLEGFGIVVDILYNTFIFLKSLIRKSDKTYRKVIDSSYRRFVLLICVSTIPTAILGYAMKDRIEAFGVTILVPSICLIITSCLLSICDRLQGGTKDAATASYQEAFAVGVSQGIATVPGLSRSGTTITACLLCGFDRDYAVKYSFIMSIPAVLGAAILELKDFSSAELVRSDVSFYLIGMLIAALVGYICIKTMLVIVRGKKFTYFSFYCLTVGLIGLISYLIHL